MRKTKSNGVIVALHPALFHTKQIDEHNNAMAQVRGIRHRVHVEHVYVVPVPGRAAPAPRPCSVASSSQESARPRRREGK